MNALVQQLAAQLNGREYRHEIEPHEEASARRDGLSVMQADALIAELTKVRP